MEKVPLRTQFLHLCVFVILLASLASAKASAFDKLTEAQSWIYDRSHLANTSKGQTLVYQYAAKDELTSNIDDQASLSITNEHDDGRRDVEIDFLTDERHLALPAFTAYRGNPVIIAMLEHVAQSISAQTGGGALYFRNRIRDALASEQVEIETHTSEYENSNISATRLTFYPFERDQHLGSDELIREARFSIDLSDDVPGGVVGIQVHANRGEQVFERTLSLM
jgi:hypothetical protein